MQCGICGKKKATVHLTEIVDDQMTELHLCEDCAREKSVQMEQQFGLADLLAGLSDFGKPSKGLDQAKLKCANCGLSYDDFRKFGRLGCSECYVSFRENLMTLLKRIHGSGKHYGKKPAYIPLPISAPKEPGEVKDEMQDLKEQLSKAILSENFEEAAKLRDMIRQKESQEGSG